MNNFEGNKHLFSRKRAWEMQIWISCCSVLWEIDFSLAFLIFLNESFARFLLMLTFFCTYGWLCLPPNIFFLWCFLVLLDDHAYLPQTFYERCLPPVYFFMMLILPVFWETILASHIFFANNAEYSIIFR